MKLTIDFPSIIDVQKELDPDLHREVFIKTANDIALRSLNKTTTRIKRKWNIVFDKSKGAYDWKVVSAIDGRGSKRRGNMNFRSAKNDNPVIVISMDGIPINDKRFDYSFDKQIASLRTNKAKLKKAIRLRAKTSPKDQKRPRIKILKKDAGATILNKAFYARFANGHEGIFRKRDGGKRIIELRTITLPSMFEQIDFEGILAQHHKDNMVKRYDHYLQLALKRRR